MHIIRKQTLPYSRAPEKWIISRFLLSHYSRRQQQPPLPTNRYISENSSLLFCFGFVCVDQTETMPKMRFKSPQALRHPRPVGTNRIARHAPLPRNGFIVAFSSRNFCGKWIIPLPLCALAVAVFSFPFTYDVCVYLCTQLAAEKVVVVVLLLLLPKIQIAQVQVHSYEIMSICFEIYFHRSTFS